MQEARSPAVTSQRTAVIRRPAGLFHCAAARRGAGRVRRAPERISARDVHRDEGLVRKRVARCPRLNFLPAFARGVDQNSACYSLLRYVCACGCTTHSLHRDFSRPWMQMLPPPHSLHRDFRRPWMQMLPPPHSLHSDFRRPWMQMLTPPHLLHRDFCRAWMHIDALPPLVLH